VKLTIHLHLVPRSKNEWSYTSNPPVRFYRVVFSYSTGITLPVLTPEVYSGPKEI